MPLPHSLPGPIEQPLMPEGIIIKGPNGTCLEVTRDGRVLQVFAPVVMALIWPSGEIRGITRTPYLLCSHTQSGPVWMCDEDCIEVDVTVELETGERPADLLGMTHDEIIDGCRWDFVDNRFRVSTPEELAVFSIRRNPNKRRDELLAIPSTDWTDSQLREVLSLTAKKAVAE